MNERQLVDNSADVRKQVGNPLPGLPILFELVRAPHQWAGIALAYSNFAFALERLAMILLQRRLVVECVNLADATAHKQRNNRFGARLEVRLLGQEWRIRNAGRAQAGLWRVRRRGSQCALPLQQSG